MWLAFFIMMNPPVGWIGEGSSSGLSGVHLPDFWAMLRGWPWPMSSSGAKPIKCADGDPTCRKMDDWPEGPKEKEEVEKGALTKLRDALARPLTKLRGAKEDADGKSGDGSEQHV